MKPFAAGDRKRTTWPSPDAIRKAADASGLPADQITEVTVLDPYFSH
ncbi:hypothetical protein ACIRVK_39995 [Streptomyces sp. NPDC101152]